MRILVTGSEGFVGRYLIEELSSHYEIIEYNRKDDVRNLERLLKKSKGADIILHTAAVIDEDLSQCIEINVYGTANVVEAANRNGCQLLIHLSTLGSIYAQSESLINENSPESDPRTMANYKLSKWMSDLVVQRFQKQWIIFRISGVYGPGRRYKPLIQKMLTENEVTVNNSNEIYDMLYVKDIPKAVKEAIERRKNFGNEIFILGSGNRKSVGEIAQIVQKVHSFKIVDKKLSIPSYSYDISKAHKLLGFTPTSFEDTLKDFMKYL